MLRLKGHTWIVALGLLLAFYGIMNAASIVFAISGAEPGAVESESQASANPTATAWLPESTGEEGEDSEPGFTPMAAPSASFPASSGTGIEERNWSSHILKEIEEAELLYPEETAEKLASRPKPAAPEVPIRIVAPAIELDAPIVAAEAEVVQIAGKKYEQWKAPDQFAAGWHVTSAPLGVHGNTVLNGHHNIYGEVFRRLEGLEAGDEILVYSEEQGYRYVITNKMILPEKYAPLEERIANAQWILPSEDERLTLVTCWPYESNTHRLILVAKPVARGE